ncbi:type II toxin-antitoxin system HicB family antitoxin [Geminocystis herdmanii]|uniref:type II toxin-antitoxin system HicB family antitoxin n=1 Tax=Geminocystis herdmanii TaxID=669359 RepID=UPI00034BB5FA|nr:type II toxin-antitoxin system HicB family antitoxin [Geminocystis herdmanii]
MKIQAIIHEAEEGGYWAEVPSLPGCVTEGDTMEELETNLREAIELYLRPIPHQQDSSNKILELIL